MSKASRPGMSAAIVRGSICKIDKSCFCWPLSTNCDVRGARRQKFSKFDFEGARQRRERS